MRMLKTATGVAVAALLLSACGGGADDEPDTIDAEESADSGGDGDAVAEDDDPVEINWVSFQPASHPEPGRVEEYFFDPASEASGGSLTFEWRGGPDTMSPDDMGLNVQNGTVDAAMIFVGAYEGVVPGVGGWNLTQLSPQEERENGAVDFIDGLHEENGIKYLGRVQPQEENFFFTWLRDAKLESEGDFSDALIGTAAGARAAVAGWGATPENVPVPDNYTALERGVVEGVAGQPLEGAVANGWHELVDYVIDHPYYQSTVVLIMNLETWESLSENQQRALEEAMIEGEQQVMDIRTEALAEARAAVEEAGVEFYELEPDVRDWYLETAFDSAWELQTENHPDVSAELRELISE
jgi:TRAP-type transport system periplasmic protein